MPNIPVNKPKDIKVGQVITASFLNQSKNGFNGISADSPLDIQYTPYGTNITHLDHGPMVRWGSVVSDYVYSDATFIKVYPMEYTETTDGVTSKIISNASDSIIKVYLTNPISTVPSDVSDITQGITLSQSDILGYMWYGQRYGTTLGGAGNFDPYFPAKLNGNTDISDNRWSYTWTEVELNITGTYSTKAGGRTNTSHGVAYNRNESGNTGSGVEGNGVNVDNLPAGFTMQPIGTNAVVSMRLETNCSDVLEPMFEVSNAIDGSCT